MRIPYSWLEKCIPLSHLRAEEIAKILTQAGLEVDSIEVTETNFEGVVVGKVLETHRHPNADKLAVASVSDGEKIYQVVCKASNCRAGLKTAFAKVGAVIGKGDAALTIKEANLRGVESFGMLCAEDELGLSEKSDGIMEISEEIAEGTPLKDLYSDLYFNISLTPNLSHCTSIFGAARELSALLKLPLNLPEIALQEANESIEDFLVVCVSEKELCPRYCSRLIRNVKVAPSPAWLRERIEKCGLRSVNNVVDVTNYILLECGHPLHAFDFDRLEGRQIVVRRANEGEAILSLDGKQRILNESMLVIADSKKPVAIAGVMGSANSEVTEQTVNIALEAAYFEPMAVRKTSKQLNLQTDASKRFERGTDPNQLPFVLDRAAALIKQVAGGEVAAGMIEVKAKEFPQTILFCRLDKINSIIGRAFSRGEVEEIFGALGFQARWDGVGQFAVWIPTYRCDIKGEIDLIEEVARLYGYDNIPRIEVLHPTSSLTSAPAYEFEKKIRSAFVEEGLQEFITCDLVGPALLNMLQDDLTSNASLIHVLNPTSIEQSILRTSLLPGLLQVVKHNFDHQNKSLAGFEVGRIHFRNGDDIQEQPVVGIILAGQTAPCHFDSKERSFDFYDLKGIIENVLDLCGIDERRFENLNLPTLHSGRQASVFIGSLELGSLGEVHPSVQRKLDVPTRLFFAEFNLQEMMKVAKHKAKIAPLAVYPCSDRDWTLTVSEAVPFAKLMELIRAASCAFLEEVTLKDIYKSEKLGQGNQNITLRFVYRDPHKTIEQSVVDAEHQRLIRSVADAVAHYQNTR